MFKDNLKNSCVLLLTMVLQKTVQKGNRWEKHIQSVAKQSRADFYLNMVKNVIIES